MGKVAWRSHDERGTVKAAKQFYYSPSDNPPYGVLPAPSTGRLLVRFISLHIKPALKGEVANVVSRRGYKAAYSSLFITTPQSHFVRQLPVKGSLMPQASYEG